MSACFIASCFEHHQAGGAWHLPHPGAINARRQPKECIMLVMKRFRRLLQVVTAVSVAATVSACGDDTAEPDPEPEVATMRLTVGTQTITVNTSGTVTGGPLVVTRGTNVAVAATWLRADGTADPLVTTAEFRLSGTSDNAATATFTHTAGFSGTIAGVAAGTTQLRFGLLHIAENHNDFGPFPVPVTVQ